MKRLLLIFFIVSAFFLLYCDPPYESDIALPYNQSAFDPALIGDYTATGSSDDYIAIEAALPLGYQVTVYNRFDGDTIEHYMVWMSTIAGFRIGNFWSDKKEKYTFARIEQRDSSQLDLAFVGRSCFREGNNDKQFSTAEALEQFFEANLHSDTFFNPTKSYQRTDGRLPMDSVDVREIEKDLYTAFVETYAHPLFFPSALGKGEKIPFKLQIATICRLRRTNELVVSGQCIWEAEYSPVRISETYLSPMLFRFDTTPGSANFEYVIGQKPEFQSENECARQMKLIKDSICQVGRDTNWYCLLGDCSSGLAVSADDYTNIYAGQVLAGRPHGSGVLHCFDGDVYTGAFARGSMNGHGRYVYAIGDTLDGQWVDDYFDGYGTLHCLDGRQYRGSWAKGLRAGEGEEIFANGDMYTGTFQNDLRHGQGIYQWPNGSCYEGSWQEGDRTGFGKMYQPNGELYEGDWQKNNRHGIGNEYAKDGSVYVGAFVNNRRHGAGTLTFRDGSCFTGEFKKGELYKGTYRFDNGSEFTGTFHFNAPQSGELIYSNGAKEIIKSMSIDELHFKAVKSLTKPIQSDYATFAGSWLANDTVIIKPVSVNMGDTTTERQQLMDDTYLFAPDTGLAKIINPGRRSVTFRLNMVQQNSAFGDVTLTFIMRATRDFYWEIVDGSRLRLTYENFKVEKYSFQSNLLAQALLDKVAEEMLNTLLQQLNTEQQIEYETYTVISPNVIKFEKRTLKKL